MIQWYVCTRSFCVPALLPSFPVTNLQGEPKPVPPLPGANALRPAGSYLQILDQSFLFCPPLTRPG